MRYLILDPPGTVTASFFSPIWAQNGTTPAKVHELELIREVSLETPHDSPSLTLRLIDTLQVHDAEVRVRLAASASLDHKDAQNLLEEAQFELGEQRQLESHLHKGLAVKAVSSSAPRRSARFVR